VERVEENGEENDPIISRKDGENYSYVITNAEIVTSGKEGKEGVITNVQILQDLNRFSLSQHSKLGGYSSDKFLQKLGVNDLSSPRKKRYCVLLLILLLVVCAIVLSVCLGHAHKKLKDLEGMGVRNQIGRAQNEPTLKVMPLTAIPTEIPTFSPSDFPTKIPSFFPSGLPTEAPQFFEVDSGTCKSNGYQNIYEQYECEEAMESLGRTNTWTPYFGNMRTKVVDGCSLKDDFVYVRTGGSCVNDPIGNFFETVQGIFTGLLSWGATDDDDGAEDDFFGMSASSCECSNDQPCFCRIM